MTDRLNILQVNVIDSIGNRFNGADLVHHLKARGHEAHLLVMDKRTDSSDSSPILNVKGRWRIKRLVDRIEAKLSVQSLLYPFSFALPFERRLREADLVHFHLIQNGYFSLLALPFVTWLKPAIWTVHDSWALTGHCVYPYDCTRWKTGCGNCPYLATTFPMRKDRTAFMWQAKRLTYRASRIELVVASEFMLNMARQSPLVSHLRVHKIPFGVDFGVFAPRDSRACKKALGIPDESIVIAFRSTAYEFKGLRHIVACLERLETTRPITLLTFNEKGLLTAVAGRYPMVELGWVQDERLMSQAYGAADLFLMPSVQEAFGMMAMEAMACGKPVIVFDGTALPEVVHAEEGGGVVVPQGDTDALLAAIRRLVENDEERRRIGEQALAIARREYDVNLHIERMIALYREVIARRRI